MLYHPPRGGQYFPEKFLDLDYDCSSGFLFLSPSHMQIAFIYGISCITLFLSRPSRQHNDDPQWHRSLDIHRVSSRCGGRCTFFESSPGFHSSRKPVEKNNVHEMYIIPSRKVVSCARGGGGSGDSSALNITVECFVLPTHSVRWSLLTSTSTTKVAATRR